jgi:DNA repair exonuclease SbcCD ATPase subunit
MNIQKIDIGIDSIDKIYHLADIHIRNLKRHDEYKTVFSRTVDYIKSTITPNSVIYLAGDIVHAKTDMTPELVQSVQEFFKMFADLAPTILITGNHDCNLNNKSRLDALTPIVNALNHPNLYYLKDSGVYEIAGTHFTVMSVFDKPADFISADKFTANFKIALHHGAVDSATTDIGFTLSNKHVDISMFEGYNLTLLGDIHKTQFLNNEKTIAYAGSLIQQNHSESLKHGILIWDLKTGTSIFKEIENDLCYYTLEVDNGVYNPIPTKLTGKQIRLRLKVKNTSDADIKTVLAEVKKDFDILEHTSQKINDFTQNKSRVQKINIGDVRDVEYQNELISKYLKNKFNLDETVLDGVRHVNRTVNSGLPKLEISRNISWIPKTFEFSNMFSYGTDNFIDFTNMKGAYGIFAPNASGKSALLESISYCIFDKCARATKASNVMNNKSNSFKCKFNFELDGKNYFIERTGTKGRADHVRVEVDFYYLEDNGDKVSLNGKERSETNDNIRNLLGNYEDFVLTALSVQNNNTGFIDMAQKDRKDLLAQFLDINIFEDLYSVANTDIKEVATLVKEYQKQDFSTQLAQADIDIQHYTSEQKSLQIDKTALSEDIDKINNEILKLTSELIPIDSSIENISSLNSLKDKVEDLITSLNQNTTDKKEELIDVENTISKLKDELSKYNITEIQTRIDALDKVKESEKTLVGQVAKLKAEVSHKLEKMEKLNDLEYDENCSFCMDNIFVKDAIATKASIEEDKKSAQDLVDKLNVVKEKIAELTPSISEKEKYNQIQKQLHSKETNKASIESDLHQIDSKYHQATAKLSEVNHKIEEYYKQQAAIESNKTLKDSINQLTINVSNLKDDLSTLNDEILSCHSNLMVSEKSKQKAEESIKKLKDLEQEYKFYQYYLEAVNRDGVPYDLISTAVPFIEQEINNILNQLVDFSLVLNMDGKNINCYIAYDNDNVWPIELTSGMEKFISSLAIRTSLINVSTLPRPNFIAIDEGFGVLDADNLNNIFTLFEYLKSQFAFMMIISHIDSMRDVVDHLIEITKISGNSKIHYT